MGLFGPKKIKNDSIEACLNMIREYFYTIGLDPNALWDDDDLDWTFTLGSASITVSINLDEDENSLMVFSPILTLPKDDLLPLFQKCLELNLGLSNCAFALSNDIVTIISQRPIEGLDKEELEEIVADVAAAADHYDDILAEEFGAQMIGEE